MVTPNVSKCCAEAGYNALMIVDEPPSINRRLFSRHPVEVAKELAVYFFGEKGEEVI